MAHLHVASLADMMQLGEKKHGFSSVATTTLDFPRRLVARTTIALFLLLLSPLPAGAELSVLQLAKQCEGREPSPTEPHLGILMCVSYISGALDQLILTDGLAVQNGSQAKRVICGPEQGKLEKISEMIKSTAKTQPRLHATPARAVVRGLIFDALRCGD